MELEKKLKYKDGTLDFYNYAKVSEGGITAQILIVPGQFFDIHMKHSIDFGLPVFASAFCKTHPDYDDIFGEAFDPKENIIMIRDEAFKLANKDELQSLVEHEFGHIFFDYSGEILSRYDYQEQLADIFVENWGNFLSLEKKWSRYNYKICKKCKTKLLMDDETIIDHWFIYCSTCGFWIGDGKINPFYIDCLIKERLGIWKNTNFKKKFNPLLSYEEDVVLTGIITEAKLRRNTYGIEQTERKHVSLG